MKQLHYISIIKGQLSTLAIMQCGEQGFSPHFVRLKKVGKIFQKNQQNQLNYIKNPKKALEENFSGFGGHYIRYEQVLPPHQSQNFPKCEAVPLATTSSQATYFGVGPTLGPQPTIKKCNRVHPQSDVSSTEAFFRSFVCEFTVPKERKTLTLTLIPEPRFSCSCCCSGRVAAGTASTL